MKGNQRYNYRDRIIDEAADWFTRLQAPERSCEDCEAFADWLCASSEHVREYLALTNLHAKIGELPTTRRVEDLIQAASYAHTENVIPLSLVCMPEQREGPALGRGRAKRLAALAASVAIVTFACVWWLYPNANTNTYTTSIGEQKSFPLPDGSLVTLNAVSKLRIRYTATYRDVQLLSGEALFTVEKNKLRPFRVLTNDSVIQAVGTQFNVYHRRAETTVTVVEGTVEIRSATSQPPAGNSLSSPLEGGRQIPDLTTSQLPDLNSAQRAQVGGSSRIIRVTKGQRAHVGAGDAPITVSAADTAADTAWRERRLTFESRPLAGVVAEFNLYNKVPFEIQDPRLNAAQVSGSFNANDPQSFASFLQEARLAKPTVEPDKIVLVPWTAR
jgi:transmembrane sensor